MRLGPKEIKEDLRSLSNSFGVLKFLFFSCKLMGVLGVIEIDTVRLAFHEEIEVLFVLLLIFLVLNELWFWL